MPKSPAKLNDRIREGIVIRFACCHGADEIRAWLKEEHRVELAPGSLAYYNGNTPGAKEGMSPKWRRLSDETRARYLDGVSDVPIAHKAHRLRLLDDLVGRLASQIRADKRVNVVLVGEVKTLLEQAAKEMGEAFTNRRILDIDARGNLAKLLGIDPALLPEGEGGDDQP
jgi:hypothetical protein